MQTQLSDKNFLEAAALIGCDVKAIKAVTSVEAPKGGFQADGNLTILFEPYIFWKQLRQHGINPSTLLKGNEDILSPVWNPKLYGKYSSQWTKLQKATMINKVAAYESASYGMFQIMGFNYKTCGYTDVSQFTDALKLGVDIQLKSFCTYIINSHLDDELKNLDWISFARAYNGPSYWKNNYDKKIKAAFLKA